MTRIQTVHVLTSLRGVRVGLVTVVITLKVCVVLPSQESLVVVCDTEGLVQLCYKCVTVKGLNQAPQSRI